LRRGGEKMLTNFFVYKKIRRAQKRTIIIRRAGPMGLALVKKK
jgi:hypothetical protein